MVLTPWAMNVTVCLPSWFLLENRLPTDLTYPVRPLHGTYIAGAKYSMLLLYCEEFSRISLVARLAQTNPYVVIYIEEYV